MLGSQAPALQLGSDTVTTSDHVRVLEVTFSSDLSLEKHVFKTCAASFHWLLQLRRIRKSLDGSAATLVHAFVTSRVDYCNAVYAEAPKTVTDKLQRVINAAARVVCDTRKFDRGLTSHLYDELHWLDVPKRVTNKMGVMVYRCVHGQAPRYLADHFTTSLRRRFSASSTFCKPSPANCTSLSTAVGRFRSPVRRSGTRCLTSSEIRCVVLTVLSSFLRQSCSVFTNLTSALEVF